MNEEFNLLGDAQFTEEEQQAFDGVATSSTPAIPQEVPATPEAVEEVTEPVEAPAEKAPAGDAIKRVQRGVDPTEKAPGSPLEGLSKFFEENIAIPLIDQFDGSRDADEVAADRDEARTEREEVDQETLANRTVVGEVG